MNELVIYYLLGSVIYIAPMVVITVCLQKSTHLSNGFIPKRLRDRLLGNHRETVGVAHSGQVLRALDSNMKKYLATVSLIALALQILMVTIITSAIIFELPLPFTHNIKDYLTMDVTYDLSMFGMITGFIGMLPIFFVVMALIYGTPMTRMPLPPEDHAPPSDEITDGEPVSQDFASINLKRLENPEETLIYAICHNDRSGTAFKLFLLQGKEEGARPQCYKYNEETKILEEIRPAPFSVDELEEIFNSRHH